MGKCDESIVMVSKFIEVSKKLNALQTEELRKWAKSYAIENESDFTRDQLVLKLVSRSIFVSIIKFIHIFIC